MRDALRVLRGINRAVHPSAAAEAPEPVEQPDRHEQTPRIEPAAETTAPLPSHWFRSATLLDVRGLKVAAAGDPAAAPIVNGISLSITCGEVVGLVGDATSGALEVAQCVAGVLPAGATIRAGSILFNGIELVGLPQRSSMRLRDTKIAFLPRDPRGSLDPAVTVGHQLSTVLRSEFGLSRPAAYERSLELLRRAGVDRPEDTLRLCPSGLSSTLALRVHVAHALAVRASLLVADNLTDNLDEAECPAFFALLRHLRRELGLTLIMVTRSVSEAARTCHRVAVVQNGKIVEYAAVGDLVASPKHPYTRELLVAAEDEQPGSSSL